MENSKKRIILLDMSIKIIKVVSSHYGINGTSFDIKNLHKIIDEALQKLEE